MCNYVCITREIDEQIREFSKDFPKANIDVFKRVVAKHTMKNKNDRISQPRDEHIIFYADSLDVCDAYPEVAQQFQ